MPANIQIEPAANQLARIVDFLNVLVPLLMLGAIEFQLIRAFWFRQSASTNPFDAFFLPLFVLLPGIIGLLIQWAIASRGKKEGIDPSTLAWLNQSLGGLLTMAYFAIAILTSELTKSVLR